MSFYFSPGYRGELDPLPHSCGITAGPRQGGTVELLLTPGLQHVTFITWITWTELKPHQHHVQLLTTPCQHPQRMEALGEGLHSFFFFLREGGAGREQGIGI